MRRIATDLIVLAAIITAGCDSPFFTLDATVTDCATQAPLAGVGAVLRFDNEEEIRWRTDEDGKLHIEANSLESETATLTLTKQGYQGGWRQYLGDPNGPVDICLEPIVP